MILILSAVFSIFISQGRAAAKDGIVLPYRVLSAETSFAKIVTSPSTGRCHVRISRPVVTGAIPSNLLNQVNKYLSDLSKMDDLYDGNCEGLKALFDQYLDRPLPNSSEIKSLTKSEEYYFLESFNVPKFKFHFILVNITYKNMKEIRGNGIGGLKVRRLKRLFERDVHCSGRHCGRDADIAIKRITKVITFMKQAKSTTGGVPVLFPLPLVGNLLNDRADYGYYLNGHEYLNTYSLVRFKDRKFFW